MAAKEVKHEVHPTGLALGITAGIIYTICAAFVAFLPVQAIRFFSYWFHGIDLVRIATVPNITPGSFVLGLGGVVVFSYTVGVVYSLVYNACVAHCRRKGWI